MKTLKLTDGTEIQVLDESVTTVLLMAYDEYAEIDTVRPLITEQNLKKATLTDEAGNVTDLHNIIPVNISVSSGYEGAVDVRFNLREKTEIELMHEELKRIHEEQEVQNEAIDFLAME